MFILSVEEEKEKEKFKKKIGELADGCSSRAE